MKTKQSRYPTCLIHLRTNQTFALPGGPGPHVPLLQREVEALPEPGICAETHGRQAALQVSLLVIAQIQTGPLDHERAFVSYL